MTFRVYSICHENRRLYIRVSSHSQKTDSQRADIRRWLIAHGHDPDAVQWFEDKETGATLQRPGLLALKEAIFAGTVGHLVAGVLFAIAEIELQHTRERQAAGITVAKVKGIYTGRAKGATKAKPRRAKELREQGLTAPEIAQILNVSERTVWRYLRGP